MARVDVNGVGIEYEVTGSGRPVVLLHGFPDSGRLWRNQVPALAGAGFQVIVPDLRGYGQSDKPDAVEAYSLMLLAGDVMAVLADLGIDRAHVVGHDWGAALAWGLASLAPATVDHLAVLSVGHPATFRRSPRQREKSWYMLLFQFPGIAERWLSADDWSNFRSWAGHPDTNQVIADLEATGSLTPGLNWYRANLPPESWVEPELMLPPVQAPTMGIWSTGDGALTEAQMTASAENVAGPWRYERLAGPGHWMQLEAPDEVNALLLDFLPRLPAVSGSLRSVEALIVVDLQAAFISGTGAVPAAAGILVTVTDLVRRAREADSLVVQLQNDGPPGAPDEPHTAGWELCLPASERSAEYVIRKDTDDGFHQTELSSVLTGHGIRHLAVCGVMSEMCVSATIRSALNLSYHVVMPHDGHATYDIPAVEGLADAVPHGMVSRVAEWALGDQIDIIPHAADIRFGPTSEEP